MAERLSDMLQELAIAGASVKELLEQTKYERAQGQSRVVLSLASRLHARLTALVEAAEDLKQV